MLKITIFFFLGIAICFLIYSLNTVGLLFFLLIDFCLCWYQLSNRKTNEVIDQIILFLLAFCILALFVSS